MASSLFFSAYEKLLLLPCAPRREISSHGVDLPPCHVPRLSLSLAPLAILLASLPRIVYTVDTDSRATGARSGGAPSRGQLEPWRFLTWPCLVVAHASFFVHVYYVVFSERSGFRRKRGWTENCFSESVRIISYILVSYAMNIVSL